MVAIRLEKDEFDFLNKGSFLSNELKALLCSAERKNNTYLLNISQDHADQIRDLCGEQLQLIGFDQDYGLTPEGKILESLIDKCFF